MHTVARPSARRLGVTSARPRRGAVLLGFLVLLAGSGWTLAEWSQSAAHARQRQDEAELLWVGQQYKRALESYYNGTPRGVKVLPATLEELLEDRRFPQPVRHLRRLYRDPMSAGGQWVVIRRGPQVIGVRSASERRPFQRSDFEPGLEQFDQAVSYAEWTFTAALGGLPSPPAAGASAAGAASTPETAPGLGGVGPAPAPNDTMSPQPAGGLPAGRAP
jgi:hypothetical protein